MSEHRDLNVLEVNDEYLDVYSITVYLVEDLSTTHSSCSKGAISHPSLSIFSLSNL